MNEKPLLLTLLLLLAGCLTFGWVQNHGQLVGGAISLPKILWLHLTLASFLVVPAFLWRNARVSPQVRRLYAWFLAGFALRGLIELPVIYFTHGWRCAYGITHDLIMMVPVMMLWWRAPCRTGQSQATRTAGLFAPLLLLVLACEILNAWLFSRVADPRTGIYFANASDAFRVINRVTWIEVAVIYPLLGFWLKQWNDSSVHPS